VTEATCNICHDALPAGVWTRLRHLRAAHPAAHRALIFRLAAPWAYLVVLLSSIALRLPIWVPIVGLASTLVTSFTLRRRAAIEAGSDAFRSTPREALRAGGYGVLALFALLAILSFVSTR